MTLLVIASVFLCHALGRYIIAGSPILGGDYSSIKRYPWLASIQLDGFHHCGGSIISRTTLLTTAHCVYKISLPSLIVRVGSSRTDSGGTWHWVVAMKHHENYTRSEHGAAKVSNDLALIKVSPPFTLGRNVSVIRLAEKDYVVDPSTVVSIAGWGTLSRGGPPSLVLQSADLLVIESDKCARRYGDKTGTQMKSNGLICTATEYGSSFCNGDSGGPLLAEDIQVGIISWSFGCAVPGYPGVYVEVAPYRDWIDKNAYKLESSKNPEKIHVSNFFNLLNWLHTS